jgi:hypothetical protein
VQDTADGKRSLERISAEVDATEEQDRWSEKMTYVLSCLAVPMAGRDCRDRRDAPIHGQPLLRLCECSSGRILAFRLSPARSRHC